MPRSVTRIRRDGVEFISNVDRVQYTIEELVRAALRDTAKFIRKRMIEQLKKLPGMKRNRRLYKSTQYWVRRREGDLQIGLNIVPYISDGISKPRICWKPLKLTVPKCDNLLDNTMGNQQG
jgi:hypothetical protein